MKLVNRAALLVAYLEVVPLVLVMALAAIFVLQVKDFDIWDRIIFPLLQPVIILIICRVMDREWDMSMFVIAPIVASAGAFSLYPNDFLRWFGLLFLLWLLFHILNRKILRLPERVSKGSP